MEDELWLAEMATKLTGIIFRKALMEKSFVKVYTRVLEQMSIKVFEDDVQILEIFGDVGG